MQNGSNMLLKLTFYFQKRRLRQNITSSVAQIESQLFLEPHCWNQQLSSFKLLGLQKLLLVSTRCWALPVRTNKKQSQAKRDLMLTTRLCLLKCDRRSLKKTDALSWCWMKFPTKIKTKINHTMFFETFQLPKTNGHDAVGVLHAKCTICCWMGVEKTRNDLKCCKRVWTKACDCGRFWKFRKMIYSGVFMWIA